MPIKRSKCSHATYYINFLTCLNVIYTSVAMHKNNNIIIIIIIIIIIVIVIIIIRFYLTHPLCMVLCSNIIFTQYSHTHT